MTGRERHAALEASIDADRASCLPDEPSGRWSAARGALVFARELLLITAVPGVLVAVAALGFEVVR